MTELEALLRTIADNPEEDTPRCILADWYDDRNEPVKAEFIRNSVSMDKATTSWSVWRNNPLPENYPVTRVELDRCPPIRFGSIESRQHEDRANRSVTLQLSWDEWDDEVWDRRRCTVNSIIGHQTLVLLHGGAEYATEEIHRRARRARTAIGYLNRSWPQVRHWTFPDDIQETPLRTMSLNQEEAFALAAHRDIRDYMMRSYAIMTRTDEISEYGLPLRLFGLLISVDPRVPPRNDRVPEVLNRDTMERWIRSPRTYEIQAEL